MKTQISCLIVVIMLLAGCAGKDYIPKNVKTDNGEAVSFEHPVMAQKKGIPDVSEFYSVMPDDFILETMLALFEKEEGKIEKIAGVFDVDCLRANGEVTTHRAMISAFDQKGFYLLQNMPQFKIEEMDKCSLFPRDRGFAYNLMGGQVVAEKDGALFTPYNPQEYDKSLASKQEFLSKYGTTVKQNAIFLAQIYSVDSPAEPNEFMPTAYRVGSKEWASMVNEFNAKIDNGDLTAKNDGGIERLTALNDKDYKNYASQMTDFRPGQKILKRTALPFISFGTALANPSTLVLAGAGLTGDALAAGIDDSIHANALRGQVVRYQLIPLVRHLCSSYRNLLAGRDEKIRQLLRENRALMAEKSFNLAPRPGPGLEAKRR